jgi:hypothetical protein
MFGNPTAKIKISQGGTIPREVPPFLFSKSFEHRPSLTDYLLHAIILSSIPMTRTSLGKTTTEWGAEVICGYYDY